MTELVVANGEPVPVDRFVTMMDHLQIQLRASTESLKQSVKGFK